MLDEIYLPIGITILLNVNWKLITDFIVDCINFWLKLTLTTTLILHTLRLTKSANHSHLQSVCCNLICSINKLQFSLRRKQEVPSIFSFSKVLFPIGSSFQFFRSILFWRNVVLKLIFLGNTLFARFIFLQNNN